MHVRGTGLHFIVWVCLLGLVGCTNQLSVDNLFSDTLRTVDSRGELTISGKNNATKISAVNQTEAFSGASHVGSGSFVSARAPSINKGTTRSGAQGFTVNLVDAPITNASKHILGDILGLSYIIDPRVNGTVTLQTTNPVSKNDIIDIFETTLALNNAGLIKRGGQYQILPLQDAIQSSPSISVPSVTPKGPGVKVQVIELRHISANEMATILQPISREGSILRVDSERNHLVLAGSKSDLDAIRDAISVFDVDWMRGMSVALHPLKTSQPSEVAVELDTIFKTQGGPGEGLIRFVPNDRLNSILVISSRSSYLRRAATWIAKLDKAANANEKQLFVYQIQNRSATDLAKVLQSVLSTDGETGSGNQGAQVSSFAPDVQPVQVSSQDGITSQTNNIAYAIKRTGFFADDHR